MAVWSKGYTAFCVYHCVLEQPKFEMLSYFFV